MSTLEKELQDLKAKNNDLAKKAQSWKMMAAQRENEKLELMNENNELRLKLSRLRNEGAAHARKLDAAIQSSCEQALSHLVQASSAVARTVQLVKTYMKDRQDLETALPRWSSTNSTPSTERVHRVPPMMIGGQSIQPVVSLSRTMVNLDNMRPNRSPNTSNQSFTERAVPMHVLQDLYIPLTRIDRELAINNMDIEAAANNSSEELQLDDSTEQDIEESQNVSEEFDDTERLLDAINEDAEPEPEEERTPRPRSENPLEGPSWMLDGSRKARKTKSRVNLEPDSTTGRDDTQSPVLPGPSQTNKSKNVECESPLSTPVACAFTPTVRRRKRVSSPPSGPPTPHSYSPRPLRRRISNNGRILKVLVSKLRLDDDDVTPPKRQSLDNPNRQGTPSQADNNARQSINNSSRQSNNSPTKRQGDSPQLSDESPSERLSRDVHLLSFDAPSPHGATSAHLVVSDARASTESDGSIEPVAPNRKLSKRDKRHIDRTSRGDARSSHENRTNQTENRTRRDDSRNARGDNSTSHDDNRNAREDNRAARDDRTRRDTNRTSRDDTHDSRSKRDRSRDNRDRSRDNSDRSRDNRCERVGSGDNQDSRGSHNSVDSDSGSGGELAEGRARRQRKPITYKEKPLNRKMRR